MLDEAREQVFMRGYNPSLPFAASCSLKGQGQEGGACWEGQAFVLLTAAAEKVLSKYTISSNWI